MIYKAPKSQKESAQSDCTSTQYRDQTKVSVDVGPDHKIGCRPV